MAFIRSVAYLWLVFFLVNSSSVKAQQPLQEINAIQKTYIEVGDFSLEMEYNLFADHKSTTSIESEKALICRKDDKIYSKMFGKEIIQNQDYLVIVNHESKMLMIDRNSSTKLENSAEVDDPLLDSLVMKMVDVLPKEDSVAVSYELKQIAPGVKRCSVFIEKGEYTHIDMIYDEASYQLKKVTYFYREPVQINEYTKPKAPRLEVTYTSFRKSALSDASLFSEKRFVTIGKNGQLRLSHALSGYRIINHLSND